MQDAVERLRSGTTYARIQALYHLALMTRADGDPRKAGALFQEMADVTLLVYPGGAAADAKELAHYADQPLQEARFGEAESLLLTAGACERSASSAGTLAERTAASLVRLYEAWHAAEPEGGHAVQAARWRVPTSR